jgi:hypothetical protein
MFASEAVAVTQGNRAEVMMEAALSSARAEDWRAAQSFFEDAAYLFREARDNRSAAMAESWLDAVKRQLTEVSSV